MSDDFLPLKSMSSHGMRPLWRQIPLTVIDIFGGALAED
jgi:hypothetical protein